MSIIHIPKRPKIGVRQTFLLGGMAVGLVAVFLRLWYLQVVRSPELAHQAIAYGYEELPSLAPRGLITDRNGVLLAGVHSQLVVTAMPELLTKNRPVLDELASFLKVPIDGIVQRLENQRGTPYLPCPVVDNVSIQLATRVAENTGELPGVDVEWRPVRYYPDPVDYAHVLGYVWTPNQRDLTRLAKAGIKPAGLVGKTGIEALYERDLMGHGGEREVQLDDKRRPIGFESKGDPVPGDKLVLSLDATLQTAAMTALEAEVKKADSSGGAVIAIDPKSGEVLCLASDPSFNAAEFLGGISDSEYRQLVENPDKPLFDRAIEGTYSPGSTFKLISTLAASKAGTFDPQRTVYCPGYFKIGNRRIRCLGHHGALEYEDALIKSCNTYFCDLAMRTGPHELRAESLQVGLGRKSGIDLPGEGKATVPTTDWLRAVQHTPFGKQPVWYPGDTANMGIGQGMISATPLQMADVACLVANRGVCYRPHLVKEIVPPDPTATPTVVEPEAIYRTSVPDTVWDDLQQAMIGVIERGTGRSARIEGLAWAGKTGSTEHSGSDKKTHGWFVGYAPAEDPKIAIAVLVEEAGHGGSVAAPIAAVVVRRYLQELGILPTDESAPESVRSALSDHATLPGSLSTR